MDTGFPDSDAQTDFSRARRRHVAADIARWLRREPDDVNMILPFDEVVAALGTPGRAAARPADDRPRLGRRHRGPHRASSTAASAPRPAPVKRRWQRIAEAMRRGEAMPPIDVYRIGGMHFVRDGHHRVSVARQLGLEVIEADVTEIVTEVGADANVRLHDLALKSHQRLFFERVPLPARAARPDPALARLWYAGPGRGRRGMGLPRDAGARRVHDAARRSPASGSSRSSSRSSRCCARTTWSQDQTEAEAYARIVSLRYLLLRTHDWDAEMLERLREELRREAAPGTRTPSRT